MAAAAEEEGEEEKKKRGLVNQDEWGKSQGVKREVKKRQIKKKRGDGSELRKEILKLEEIFPLLASRKNSLVPQTDPFFFERNFGEFPMQPETAPLTSPSVPIFGAGLGFEV